MTSNLSTLSFEDYSSLAHGVAKNLPEGTAIKGSQVLNAMAKHKGFKSAQAFKASFIPLKSKPGKLDKRSPDNIHEPSKAMAYFVEVLRKMAHIEFGKKKPLIGFCIKDWILKYHGSLTNKPGLQPTLFDHIIDSEIYYTEIVNPYLKGSVSFESFQANNYLESLDPDLLNEAYNKHGARAQNYVSQVTRNKTCKEDELMRWTLEQSWMFHFQDAARSFFNELEPHLLNHVEKNYRQKNSSELDVARFFLKANPFELHKLNEHIESALNNIDSECAPMTPNRAKESQDECSRMKHRTALQIRDLFMDALDEKNVDYIWKSRVSSFLSGLTSYLVYRRDVHGATLDIDAFRSYATLDNFAELSFDHKISSGLIEKINLYLHQLPGFAVEDARIGQVSARAYEQHATVLTLFDATLSQIFEK
jgi:hypothetical protein